MKILADYYTFLLMVGCLGFVGTVVLIMFKHTIDSYPLETIMTIISAGFLIICAIFILTAMIGFLSMGAVLGAI